MQNSIPIPTRVLRNPRKSRLKFIVAGLIIVAAIAALAFQTFQSTMMFYLTIPEVRAQVATEGDVFYGRTIRVSGALHRESIDWNAKTMDLAFHLNEGGDMFPVKYNGLVPDTFHHSDTVVAEGRYTREGVFEATTILVKCPSKYEAAK